jgi:arsenite methyltransferase
MKRQLDVFDPPMCCSTGVCGADVDAALVQFAADVAWLASRGVAVRRFNLSHDPPAFINEPAVLKAMTTEGTQCLPLVVVNGQIVSRRAYPTRDELVALAGLAEPASGEAAPGHVTHLELAGGPDADASCCATPAGDKSGCCSR